MMRHLYKAGGVSVRMSLTCLFYVHEEMSPIYETFSSIKKAPGK